MGGVPLLGRGYVVYFLTVAVGGGAGLYVVSSKRVKGVAASQARFARPGEHGQGRDGAQSAKHKAPEPACRARAQEEKKPRRRKTQHWRVRFGRALSARVLRLIEA